MNDILINKFKENFNMAMVARDLIYLIDKKLLLNYIIDNFNDNFSYGELYDLFKNDLSKEELEKLLNSMGHTFIDLDSVNSNTRELYY